MNGDEIKKWRKANRISQAKLAKLCHMKESSVANWELGRNNPSGPALAQLAKIMSGDVAIIELSSTEEKLLNEALKLSDASTREELLDKLVLRLVKTGGVLTAACLLDILP